MGSGCHTLWHHPNIFWVVIFAGWVSPGVTAAASNANAPEAYALLELISATGRGGGRSIAAGAEVDSGVVDSFGLRQPISSRLVRWRNGKGAHLVWTFRATIMHQASSARFELVNNATDPTPLRYAKGTRTNWAHAKGGRVMPKAGPALVHGAVLPGHQVMFEIAMPILDTSPLGVRRPSFGYHVIPNGHAKTNPPINTQAPKQQNEMLKKIWSRPQHRSQ